MRDNRDILEKLRATIADMEYMEVPGEWLVPVEEARDEITRLRADNLRLRAALREVMDDLILISKNHWLPVGLLDDVIYVNARAALDGQPRAAAGGSMSKDITIPPDAVEAAARAAYAEWVSFCVASGGVEDEYRAWDELDDEERIQWRTHATAAIRAGIAAWPGMWHIKAVDFEGKVILPLPQEARDD